MRLLITADVHLEKATHGKLVGGRSSRLDDFGATLLRFAESAVEKKADLAIVAGDLFDNRRPGPEAIHAAVRAFHVLSSAKVRTIVVPGNHDGMGTIANPGSHTLTWMSDLDMPFVHVLLEPGIRMVGTPSGQVMIVSVPYPHKRAYDVTLDEAMLDRVEAVSREVEQTIGYMLSKARESELPVIFVGHLTVVGGMAGPERAMKHGWDVSVSADVLGAADFAALGHLHPQQMVRPNVWYAGAPDFHEFGEEGPKGFLLVDVEQAKVENVPSNPRPMVAIDLHEDMAWGPVDGMPDFADATVLLRFHPTSAPRVPADVLATTRRAVYGAGAFLVKDVTVVPERVRRARIEIDPEVDVLAAVERWATANGIDPAQLLPVAEELVGFRAES